MQISVFGRTEKRPAIYTLISILMHMGDVAVITNNRQYMRLMEDGPAASGTWNNVSIFITDATADEMWAEVGMSPDDFNYVILDNLYNESTNFMFYVQGAGIEASDTYLFDIFPELPILQMGKAIKKKKIARKKPKKGEEASDTEEEEDLSEVQKGSKVTLVAWDKNMLENIEKFEYYRMLGPISSGMANALGKLLSPVLNMPANDIAKVANRT